jgi:hypothetical protein
MQIGSESKAVLRTYKIGSPEHILADDEQHGLLPPTNSTRTMMGQPYI